MIHKNVGQWMKPLSLLIFILCMSTLFGCTSPKQVVEVKDTVQISISPTPEDTATPIELDQPIEEPTECIQVFQKRELAGDYQKDKQNPVPRFTLSAVEFKDYLREMGIESLCIPPDFGEPFINVDWDSEKIPATTGRMLSLGFENLYPGGGWSEGFILYATYDFSTGTEYESFADQEDYEALSQGLRHNSFEVEGIKGFARVKKSDICFGKCTAYKAYIFPFQTSYLAFVYSLGAYDDDANWESTEQGLNDGHYPPEIQANLAEMEMLVTSLRFTH